MKKVKTKIICIETKPLFRRKSTNLSRFVSICVISLLLFTSIVIASKPTPNPQNQYYIFGDNTDAIPHIGFNWTNNETYVYPYNQSLWYRNETNITFDLGIAGGATPPGDGYAGASGHPHDQDLNTTNDVDFASVTIVDYYVSGEAEDKCLFLGSPLAGLIYEEMTDGEPETYTLTLNNLEGDDMIFKTSDNADADRSYDLQINTIGAITTPYQPASRARLSTAQSVPATTWTRLLLATEDYDQNEDFASYRFVAPANGLYAVSYSVYITDLATDDFLSSSIYVNGVRAGGSQLSYASVTGGLANSGSDCFSLSATDYVELYVYHNYGFGNRFFSNLVYSNYMTVYKVA